MTRSVGDGLSDLRGRLAAAGIEGAPREARRIMAAALGVAPDRVSLMQTDPLPAEAEDRLTGMAARRCARPRQPPDDLNRSFLAIRPRARRMAGLCGAIVT